MQKDESAKVRYQLLCTLGNIKGNESEKLQQQLLMKDVQDKWVQIAALTTSAGHELALLEKTLPVLSATRSEGRALFFSNCANLIGISRNTTDIKRLLRWPPINIQREQTGGRQPVWKGLVQRFLRRAHLRATLKQRKPFYYPDFHPRGRRWCGELLSTCCR
jgi:hypothetical protein